MEADTETVPGSGGGTIRLESMSGGVGAKRPAIGGTAVDIKRGEDNGLENDNEGREMQYRRCIR